MITACTGAIWLTVQASLSGSPWKIIGVGVYDVTLTLFCSISAAYHSVRGRAKVVVRKLDHLSIYLPIAGSYTPFCLATPRGPWGWILSGAVWGLAVLGMLQEIKPCSEARMLSAVIYTVMGWIVLIAAKPLFAVLGNTGLTWLAVGGVLYTVGIVFYAYDHRSRRWHGIWHLSVIAGSFLHFAAIWCHVLQTRSGTK